MKEVVKISSKMIQLNQLLKWIGLLETGGQTAFLLSAGKIKLNDAVVHEKRKKIYPGDTLFVEDQEYQIVQDRDTLNNEY